jgi:hypothetical protein
MFEATGDSSACPWKGKRLTQLALGHIHTLTARVGDAASPRFTRAMLLAPPAIARRILQIVAQVKRDFCAEIMGKFSYYEHIPHKICGAFGAYFGYTLEESKKCTRECFEEFRNVEMPEQQHYVSLRLFDEEHPNTVTTQLHEFAFGNATTPLDSYLEAFLEVQELCFGSSVERYVESLHKVCKTAGTRGLRYCKPAYTCARARRPQIVEMIENPRTLDWLVQHWDIRTLHTALLDNTPTAEVLAMTQPKRLARIYGYDKQSHFRETTVDTQSSSTLSSCFSRAQKTVDVPVTQCMTVGIEYLKCRLPGQCIFSCPRDLFAMASPTSGVVPAGISLLQLAEAVGPRDPAAVADPVFFDIRDARPEGKFHVRNLHVATSRHYMVVSVLRTHERHDGITEIMVGDAGSQEIDIAQWASHDTFPRLIAELRQWDAAPRDTIVELMPSKSALALNAVPHLRPPAIVGCEDTDMLADLKAVDETALVSYNDTTTIVPYSASSLVPYTEDPCRAIVSRRRHFSRGAIAIATTLVDLSAFNEFDGATEIESIRQQFPGAIEELLESGVIAYEPCAETFVNRYSVKLNCMQLGITLHCVGSRLVTQMPSRQVPIAKLCKLELIEHLMLDGWEPLEVMDDTAYYDGDGLAFVALDSRPKSYFRCLASRDAVFKKPGGVDHILHLAKDSYYVALLTLPNLQQIADKTDAELLALADGEYKRAIREGGVDGDADVILALEDGDAGVGPIAPPPPLLVPELAVRVSVTSVTDPMHVVHFDNYSHCSGNQRAFLYCARKEEHGRCRQYIFVKDFASPDRAVAHLLAWASLDMPDRESHTREKPTDAQVDIAFAEQFG